MECFFKEKRLGVTALSMLITSWGEARTGRILSIEPSPKLDTNVNLKKSSIVLGSRLIAIALTITPFTPSC